MLIPAGLPLANNQRRAPVVTTTGEQYSMFASGTAPTTGEQDTVFTSGTFGSKRPSVGNYHLPLANKILCSPYAAADARHSTPGAHTGTHAAAAARPHARTPARARLRRQREQVHAPEAPRQCRPPSALLRPLLVAVHQVVVLHGGKLHHEGAVVTTAVNCGGDGSGVWSDSPRLDQEAP